MSSATTGSGDFELDVAAYELRRNGEAVKLERIPMELLMFLVERQGQLVTRAEIIEKLWGADVFFDADNGINTAIRKVRRAFGDNPDNPAFIQTLTGKGYRFIGALRGRQTAANAPTHTLPVRAMLAVLPFENLSSDPEQEYFSDGLTEETISFLGQMNPESLGVIARTSIMMYKRTNKNIGQIGRELGVDYILESSVRREGRRVRITSQLILVKEQTHLWAETYDRDVTSFLSVQAELGQAISGQVRLRLNPRSRVTTARPLDPDAYDLFLRGKYHGRGLRHRQAIECFQQAIDKDPSHGPSYAGLASACAALPLAFDQPPLSVLPRAQRAATRAVELDDHSSDAHASLGIVKMWLEWDWTGAELAFLRALQLNASHVMALLNYGHLLSTLGRHAEALLQIARARQIDPLTPTLDAFAGIFRYLAGDHDRALENLRNALVLQPDLWLVHLFLGKVYERKGRLDEAMGSVQKALDLSGNHMTEQISLKGYLHAMQGNRTEAEATTHFLIQLATQKYVPPCNIAMIYAGLGDTGNALRWLEKAYEVRDVLLTFLAVEPKWDVLRTHSDFKDLLRKISWPDLAKSSMI